MGKQPDIYEANRYSWPPVRGAAMTNSAPEQSESAEISPPADRSPAPARLLKAPQSKTIKVIGMIAFTSWNKELQL